MPIPSSRSADRFHPTLMFALAAAMALAGCGQARNEQAVANPNSQIGLYTSLPIVWNENQRVADLLASDAPTHWLLTALRSHGQLVPLDSLAESPGSGALPLPGDAILVLAQPRPLSPQENVALDDWVRGGGRVLLFADPMLTEHSIYALGDARRPQDVALLSPILARWGLELEFDEAQPAGERVVAISGTDVPVNLAGRFRVIGPGCDTQAGGLLAICRIGKGRVVALADAALLENDSPDDSSRKPALDALLSRLD